MQWDSIFSERNLTGVQFHTARCKVLGGWLINHAIEFRGEITSAVCFLPDSEYKWEVDKIPKNNIYHMSDK